MCCFSCIVNCDQEGAAAASQGGQEEQDGELIIAILIMHIKLNEYGRERLNP